MAKTINYKRISSKFVEKNYPGLYAAVEKSTVAFTSGDLNLEAFKEMIYGLSIEIALKSDGTVSLFTEDEDDIFINEDLD